MVAVVAFEGVAFLAPRSLTRFYLSADRFPGRGVETKREVERTFGLLGFGPLNRFSGP